MNANVKEVAMLHMERLRRERAWSQAELARRAGLNQSTVCSVETERFIPYPSQLRKLAAALSIREGDEHTLLSSDSRVEGE